MSRSGTSNFCYLIFIAIYIRCMRGKRARLGRRIREAEEVCCLFYHVAYAFHIYYGEGSGIKSDYNSPKKINLMTAVFSKAVCRDSSENPSLHLAHARFHPSFLPCNSSFLLTSP